MTAAQRDADPRDPVPALAPGCNPMDLPLTPQEGYLLSRVDGHTPCSQLRQIGGMPADDVDRCIERWQKDGVIQIGGVPSGTGQPSGVDDSGTGRTAAEAQAEASTDTPPKLRAQHAALPLESAELVVDQSLDLTVEFQEQVLDFVAQIDAPYHEILGVDIDADNKTIKKAYFGLSKSYHPDRYFRKNTGPYGVVLDRIFKRVLEAYELLSDPVTREEVQREVRAAAAAEAGAPDGASEGAASPVVETQPLEAKEPKVGPKIDAAVASRRLRDLRRQKARGGFVDRKAKAKKYFESGMSAFRQERWLEAAGSVRLAIAFDPKNKAFRESFAEVQTKAHAERAKTMMAEGERHLEMRDYAEALRCFGEAIHYRPFDGDLLFRASRLAWQVEGNLHQAKEWGLAAVEIDPEHAGFRRLLGQIYKEAGLTANARRELQAALRLDPQDAEAKAELKGL